jgi:hypothetical protein
MDFEFMLGSIVGVFPSVNTVVVRPYETGSQFIDIPLTPPTWLQVNPDIGMQVFYFQYSDQFRKVVQIWENDDSIARQGSNALAPREVQVQGGGRSYALFDAAGRISLVDGSMINNLVLSKSGLNVLALQVLLQTFSGLQIGMDQQGQFSIVQTGSSSSTEQISSLTISSNGSLQFQNQNASLTIDNKGKITASGTQIQLVQNGDTVPGGVVTSGPTGVYPFDLLTGQPIPYSSTVQASS